ncbi:hypothetical protein [Candidatus Nitrosotalea sp. TS]|uniref:hypothetical protein n=1 Tax=Candidatus Nitrosotalea sp. TS TaxID=2341020 RepID=UPI001C49922F|nr:hypothetical protein [Candidatus Nitrosotalea sp. TS]
MTKDHKIMRYSEDMIWMIWSKGEIFAGNDPVFWRKDRFGAWIFRGHYGRTDSEYGWVIDPIRLLSDGETVDISNLAPVHWENTIKAGGNTERHVTSTGIHNERPLEPKAIEIQNMWNLY